ncbi:acetoacetate--CoA ligase [Virgibacillus sp. YIM 98842]|uniref:acetoacetate--CoA ligase n=1 Tax=Virgibacillus sp. YIM 98842 TaxID=2663533 RepID=UPI0013DAFEB3|nr:acetoacetate--CoA ligase [Virgibacillus sp. YIM 98842]
MSQIKEGTLLWEPDEKWKQKTNIQAYMEWLNNNKNLQFYDYHSLWKWSVNELEAFWESQWEYFDIQSTKTYTSVLSTHKMPGAKWFDGAEINYTEHIFRNRKTDKPAIIHASEIRETSEITWNELYKQTAAMQKTLKNLGVQKGDRIVAYAPNIYETIIVFLASASLGAIWSSASPDFGTQSVIDRFKQIEPKVMVTVDGYLYGGKNFERMETVKEIQAELPTLEATIAVPYLNQDADFSALKNPIIWQDAVQTKGSQTLTYEPVPFNDPLWVLFSSGTTGKPKPIVQSQGGILLEHLKALTFHSDLDENDRFFWFTTTGWMMWNFLVSGLLTGSTVILYDGNPAYPDKNMLWKFAEDTKMTVFGTSASYITGCMKDENLQPGEEYDLSHLKSIGSTGSPLPPEGFNWCYENVKQDVWIASASGGTDVCTAFISGTPILPVYAGELQCRALGAKIESFSDDGNPQIEEVGELVLTKPFPSMPIYFWGDPDGSRLYESYFDVFPGIWCHGDYLKVTDRHTCVIYGRSDATINRAGIRIGTSEIYRAVDQVKAVADSLIVDIPKGNDSETPLFVQMKEGYELTEDIKQAIKRQIRTQCSPRHVPTGVYEVEDLPKTLNGKKLEIPVKKILMGKPVEQVVNKGSLSNEKALDYFVEFAGKDVKL